MKKYILGAVFFLAVLVTPLVQAQAAGLTNTQVRAILSLLSSFGADQSVINNVQASLTGGGTTTPPQSWCHTFSTDLTVGSNGIEVQNLQVTLGRESVWRDTSGNHGYVGTFDENVAAAVVQFQAKYGIRQTGYVGPLTRAKLNSLYGCSNPGSSSSFSASPTYGTAPLSVGFTSNVSGGTMNFGDGRTSGTMECAVGATVGAQAVCGSSHTYTAPGIYTATLQSQLPCTYKKDTNSTSGAGASSCGSVTIGKVIITVTSGATTQTPTTPTTATFNFSSSGTTLTWTSANTNSCQYKVNNGIWLPLPTPTGSASLLGMGLSAGTSYTFTGHCVSSTGSYGPTSTVTYTPTVASSASAVCDTGHTLSSAGVCVSNGTIQTQCPSGTTGTYPNCSSVTSGSISFIKGTIINTDGSQVQWGCGNPASVSGNTSGGPTSSNSSGNVSINTTDGTCPSGQDTKFWVECPAGLTSAYGKTSAIPLSDFNGKTITCSVPSSTTAGLRGITGTFGFDPVMGGGNCKVQVGKSSCGTHLAFHFTNIPSGTIVDITKLGATTSFYNTTVSSGSTEIARQIGFALPLGTTTLYPEFRDGEGRVSSATQMSLEVPIVCDTGLTPNSAGVCVTSTQGAGTTTINSFTASPTSITAGQSTTLSWTSTGADIGSSCALNYNGMSLGLKLPNSSFVVSPTVTTTYDLTCAKWNYATSINLYSPTSYVTVTVGGAGAAVTPAAASSVILAVGNSEPMSDAQFALYPIFKRPNPVPVPYQLQGIFTLSISGLMAQTFNFMSLENLVFVTGAAQEAAFLLAVQNARDYALGSQTLAQMGVTVSAGPAFNYVDTAGTARSVPSVLLTGAPGTTLTPGVFSFIGFTPIPNTVKWLNSAVDAATAASAPTVTSSFSPSTISSTGSTVYRYDSQNTTHCVSSHPGQTGGWDNIITNASLPPTTYTAAQFPNGLTTTITCYNAAGQSAVSTQTLTVTAPAATTFEFVLFQAQNIITWYSSNTNSCEYKVNNGNWLPLSTIYGYNGTVRYGMTSLLGMGLSAGTSYTFTGHCISSDGSYGPTSTVTYIPTVAMNSTSNSNTNQTASAFDAFANATNARETPSTESTTSFHYVWNNNLEIGSSYTEDVSALQTALTREGVYTGEISGGFYNQTFSAVKAFQQKYGIDTGTTGAGFVGSQTRAKLNTLY